MAGCRMFWRQACYVPGAPGCTDDQNSLSTFPKPPWCTAPSGWDPPAGGCHTNRLHSAGTARHANRRTGVGRSVCLSVRQSVPSLPECLCQVSCFNPPRPRPSPLLPVALEENHPPSSRRICLTVTPGDWAFDLKSLSSDVHKWKRSPFQ